jgi:hypothetical protein
MFIAALFTIAKSWNQPRCPRDKWIRKMWKYTIEYYSAIKNKIMSFARKWMELEIMLCEISQTQEDKCFFIFRVCILFKDMKIEWGLLLRGSAGRWRG